MYYEYETEHLTLRVLPPTDGYARLVLRFYNDNQLDFETYEAKRPSNFYTEAYQKSLLNCEYQLAMRLKSIRFWLFEKNQFDHIVGTICFYNITHYIYERCEVGYKLDSRYRHLGYAKEALTLGLSLMFEELNLHRIEAYVMEKNTPSIRLIESLGFSYEGTCRQAIRIQDRWEDHRLYSLLR